ncbi:MAG: S8 family peptidase [Bacteroidota bacterium]
MPALFYAQSEFDRNRIIIAFEDGTTPQERSNIRQDYNANLIEFLPKLNIEIWDVFNFPLTTIGGDILNDIIEVQDHATRKAKVTGGGLDYEVQYPENDLDDCNADTGQVYDPLPCCAEEDVNCGVDNNLVRVGIIDTGADLLSPQSFYTPYQVDATGYDFISNTLNPLDLNGHGTQMTSIIGGILQAQGAPNVRLTPLKSLGADGTGALSDIVRAVHFAICENIDILNMSFGYKTVKTDVFDQFFKIVLQEAINQNMLPIAAAGNLGECIGINNPYYPAAFDLEGMLTVGASECTAGYAPFSNYGEPIDILAPGVKVFCRDTAYGNWIFANGTSHATAIASGMAASFATTLSGFDAVTVREEILLELNPCISNILDADVTCHPAYAPLDNLSLTVSPTIDSLYSAMDTLCSIADIPDSLIITYKAGETILLKPGFQVQHGACFVATIFDCEPYIPEIVHHLESPSNVEVDLQVATAIHEEAKLFANYPNPFYLQTTIPYFIPETARQARLKIVDAQGQLVYEMAIRRFGKGSQQLTQQLHAGLYFCFLYMDGEVKQQQKMLVVD